MSLDQDQIKQRIARLPASNFRPAKSSRRWTSSMAYLRSSNRCRRSTPPASSRWRTRRTYRSACAMTKSPKPTDAAFQRIAPQTEAGLYLVPKVIECRRQPIAEPPPTLTHDKPNMLNARELASALDAKADFQRRTDPLFLQRIEALNPAQCVHHRRPRRRAGSRECADASRAAGDAGPLTGIPIAHKDVFCTEGCSPPAARRCCRTSSAPTTRT